MPNRTLTDHIVLGDKAAQLKIEVTDGYGSDGANHRYEITGFDTGSGITNCTILFQDGPIKEEGVNGVTQDALIAIVIDRLRSFQATAFWCRENYVALARLEEALLWMQRRTADRIKRGVEGTNNA